MYYGVQFREYFHVNSTLWILYQILVSIHFFQILYSTTQVRLPWRLRKRNWKQACRCQNFLPRHLNAQCVGKQSKTHLYFNVKRDTSFATLVESKSRLQGSLARCVGGNWQIQGLGLWKRYWTSCRRQSASRTDVPLPGFSFHLDIRKNQFFELDSFLSSLS